jgi:pilus assembly protein Flp/PilA
MNILSVRYGYVRLHLLWLRFTDDRKAVTAIEYALIAALIAIAIISAVTKVGVRTSSVFNTLSSEL